MGVPRWRSCIRSEVTRLNSLGCLVTLLWQVLASNQQWNPSFQSFVRQFCSAQSLALPRSKALLLQTPCTCSQLVHSVAIYARLSNEPSLHLPCCSPRRFQSAVTLIALPWQISHSCQEDTLWLLMTIREKMGIRRKGSVRGEMRGVQGGGLGSGSLVKLGRVEGGSEGGRRGWIRRVKEEKVTCGENEVQERRHGKLQTIKAAAQLSSEDETFWTERVWLGTWELQTNSLKVSHRR